MAEPAGGALRGAPRGVLVTRAEPAASGTARRLDALGFAAVVAPLLRVRPLPAPLPALSHAELGAVLVTSGNALASLPDALHATPLLAVGDATAALARSAGFQNVRSAAGDADALAALARASLPRGARLLLASGRGQGAPLAAALRADGFRVHRRAMYDAVAVGAFPPAARRALEAGALCAALFLSAETARAFVRLLPSGLAGRLGGVSALAIGGPAADALRVLPWQRVRVSLAPNLEGVLALL